MPGTMEKETLMYVSNIKEPIPQEEYENLNLVFSSLDASSRLTNASMFVIDFSKNKMIYRSRSLIFTDEATMKDIQRTSANPYWSLITERDLDSLLETRSAYLKTVETFTMEQKLHHTFVIDYNILLQRREHTVTQKFTPLMLRPDGTLWLGLFTITTSPHKSCEHVALFGNDFRYVYDFEEKVFTPFDQNMKLSLTERAILLRSAKGMTSEEIAEDLYRSAETIKTHRKRLFKKLHVNSMSEAIVFVSNYDLW